MNPCHVTPIIHCQAVTGQVRFMRTLNKPPAAPESDWPKLQEKHETNMVICGQDMVKKWLVMKPQYISTHNHIHIYIIYIICICIQYTVY